VTLLELPYILDSSAWFERIRDLPQAAFLDSSFPYSRSGRYDILTADPIESGLAPLPSSATEFEASQYFASVSRFHREYYGGIQPAAHDIPFTGGILGFVGYDAGNALHNIAAQGLANTAASAQLHAYDWCVVQDHLLRRSVLVTQPSVSASTQADLVRRFKQSVKTDIASSFNLLEPFASNFSKEAYRDAFNRIADYIQAGDCYQVNLAQCFTAPFEGDPWQAYQALRKVAAAPFSAYLSLPHNDALMCLSPERFISLHGHAVETSPIKGTRPRYKDPQKDELAAAELLACEKDRAENLMIVDLLRNDLGRSCVPGSIHVDRLFEVQSFPTVHHLVSTISGELLPERSAWELLRDSFPGGSITGAPKRRAMQIIAELENKPRQAYCGSVIYVSADGRMDSNIAIRSLLCEDGEVKCWGGGGIVADSQWEEEYQETLDKIGSFLSLLETL